MFRKVNGHVLSLTKRIISSNQCILSLQSSTSTAEATLPQKPQERPSHFKSIVEVGISYGIPSHEMETTLDTNKHLLRYNTNVWSTAIKSLSDFGFHLEDVLKMLSECPELLQMKPDKLLINLQTWYECNFGDELCLLLLSTHPKLITAEKLDIVKRVQKLTPYLEGKTRVAKAIYSSTTIFYENWNSIFEKLTYLNELLVEPIELCRTNILAHDLHHIKMRHEFLIRAGLYKLPTKHYKKSLDTNPKLNKIVNTTDRVFAMSVAGLTVFEYEVFQDMFEKEEEEKKNDMLDDSDDE